MVERGSLLGDRGGTSCAQHPKPRTENPMMALTAAVSRFQSEQPPRAGREAGVCHLRVLPSKL